ncbi:MAG: Na/Pi cotransporter family protein [Melioribacteraceae bacterium]|nr:Na/Pi cotransporter family protein [Melioribacteraceae bacterium]
MKKIPLYIFVLLLNLSLFAQLDSLGLQLKTPASERHTQAIFTTAGDTLKQPFAVFVIDSSNSGVPNIPIVFGIISQPENEHRTKIHNELVYTDSSGFARTNISLGKKAGTYIFSARIKDYHDHEKTKPIYLTIKAREPSWVFILASGVIGGLGLFLLGLHMLSTGLKKTAGNKMRAILSKVTNNRFVAVGIGALITMVIQSSSATTVMLVSFVKAKLMTFTQTLGIILGAAIGTTITLQLIAFKITDFALLIIGIGFVFYFFSKSKKFRNIGESILGFGILFFGMYIMSDAMSPLRTYQPFINVLLELENPLLGILIGTILTALLQSSSAFLGIVLILSMQGLITLDAAIPLIFGANIGTSITAILASINANRDAKRVALAHTLFKVVAVLIFVWFIPAFSEFTKMVSPSIESAEVLAGSNSVIPRQIANAHTVFNVLFTILFLPFLTPIADLIYKNSSG